MERNQVIAIVVICVIMGGTGLSLMFLRSDIVIKTCQAEPTLTAYGHFDRVELVDRHFGDFNGQEVEDDVMAVLTENGTVSISDTHYEGLFGYHVGYNYLFFLYIYDGIDHLRERISVVCNTTETYYFLNVTVTVSLSVVWV